jgi:AcrR family transcriptional regulator
MMAHRQPGLAQQQDMGEQHQAAERPESLRADAQQNRDRILEVARDALAVSGDASLNSIAKRAGVGPGTLYRHFPTREALVLAVYRHDVQQLADSAAALLKEHPPLEALRLWLDRLAYYGRIKHGLADVLHAATSDGLVGETYGPVIRAITLLLRACEEAGSVRPGLDPDDVLLLMGFLWRIDASDDWQARASRMLDLVMDGLRTGAPAGPVPGMTHPSAPLYESRGLTTPYRLSLLSNINNNPLVRKACAAHPGLGQRALYTLTSAPGAGVGMHAVPDLARYQGRPPDRPVHGPRRRGHAAAWLGDHPRQRGRRVDTRIRPEPTA